MPSSVYNNSKGVAMTFNVFLSFENICRKKNLWTMNVTASLYKFWVVHFGFSCYILCINHVFCAQKVICKRKMSYSYVSGNYLDSDICMLPWNYTHIPLPPKYSPDITLLNFSCFVITCIVQVDLFKICFMSCLTTLNEL